MTSNRVTSFLELAMKRAIEKTVEDQLITLNELRGKMINRVFFKGLNSSGQTIGVYSTNPMLVGGKSFSELGGQAKASQAIGKIFATKAVRKKQQWVKTKTGKNLVVLPGGYKQYRELLGRKSEKVNLDLTGDLRGSIVVAKTNGRLVIGIRDVKNAQKRKYLEQKYGRVFSVTTDEKTGYANKIDSQLKRNFNTVFQNAN